MALPGEYRDEVVIDKYLRLGVRHTEQFMEDRRKLIDEANLARDQYGELSIPYQKAKLNLNKWLAENVEQEYIKEYYDKVNSNLDFILDNNSSRVLQESAAFFREYSKKIAYRIGENSYTYKQLYKYVCNLYNYILENNKDKAPIIIFGGNYAKQ